MKTGIAVGMVAAKLTPTDKHLQMPLIINFILLVLGLVLTAIGLIAFYGNPGLFIVLALGVGLIFAAFVSDRRRERRAAEKRRHNITHRIAELTKAPWPSHQTMKILSNVRWMLLVIALMGTASAGIVYIGITEGAIQWPPVLSGSFLLALTLFALPRNLLGLGKPSCELDRNGFVTPIHGRIPWHEVNGIHLQQFTNRGVTVSTLFIRVENYRRVVADIHWTERILAIFGLGALRRGIVAIRLNDSKEVPETIYAVARFLWKQSTARDYDWVPMQSDAFNESLKRLGEMASRHPSPDDLKRQLIEHPEEALAELEQFNKDTITLRTEHGRQMSRFKWAIGVGLALMLLIIAWPWLNQL